MLLPVLKPAAWKGLEADVRAHVWIGTPEDPRVVVAYAHHRDGRRDYVDTSSDWSRSDRMVRQAFATLTGHHTGFDLIEHEGSRLLISSGDRIVTDRILIQSHMLLAHEKLEAEELVVSIARPGLLLACGRDGGPSARRTMLGAHAEALRSAGAGQLLFADLVVLREGRLAGTLAITEPWT